MSRRPVVVVALLVALVAAPVLMVLHHAPVQPLPGRVAIRDALRSESVIHSLVGTHWTTASASALDGRLERVSFFDGAKTVTEVAVDANGTIAGIEEFGRRSVPFGNYQAYQRSLLVVLSLMFILMLGVVPLRRMRNLDVLAVLSLLAAVILYQHGYLRSSVLAVLPGLGYLSLRCAWRGLVSDGGQADSTPIFEWATRSLDPGRRVRVLRVLLLALALVLAVIGVSSPNAIDVAYAAMEGATQIIHGLLPYGHMPGDVIHGDTYPILSYALYAPLAWVAPVGSILSPIDGMLDAAVLAALVTAAVLYRAAAGRRSRPRDLRAEAAGLRAAIAWLSFPPLMIIVSTGTTDVALGMMLAFAVLLWRRPAASMAVLALAGWFKLAPFALVPVWLAPLRGRRLAGALGGFAAVSAATIGLVLALGGVHGPAAMLHAVAYQFSRSTLQSPWVALGITTLQPIGQACVLALIAAAAARLALSSELAADRARIAALSAAILIALQLVSNYWTFFYLAWILPLACLSLFAEPAGATVLTSARERVRESSPAAQVSDLTPVLTEVP
jgi:hypothetical protein